MTLIEHLLAGGTIDYSPGLGGVFAMRGDKIIPCTIQEFIQLLDEGKIKMFDTWRGGHSHLQGRVDFYKATALLSKTPASTLPEIPA